MGIKFFERQYISLFFLTINIFESKFSQFKIYSIIFNLNHVNLKSTLNFIFFNISFNILNYYERCFKLLLFRLFEV